MKLLSKHRELIHAADIHTEADSFTFQAPSSLDTELITTNNIFFCHFFFQTITLKNADYPAREGKQENCIGWLCKQMAVITL